MKPQIRRFCELVASGMYTNTAAAIEAGYSPKTARSQASTLLTKPNIQNYIKDLQEQHAKAVNIDAEWCRKELIRVKQLAIDTGDLSNAAKSIDLLNRMGGYYAKDNEQQQAQITINTKF